ncbi:MAG: UvrD-helicase domain-containing protein [Fibrobacter sp.]|nr:UvrD-helicase domain-containing protein [Fibrobacter sp.]
MNELQPFNSKNIAYIKEFDVSNPKSLFIEASAGTGKTYTIQQMVARMIADGTELKKILIVTYTEKAAGELKDRIRKKMEEVLETGKINKDFNPDADDAKDLDPTLNLISKQQRSLFENALRDVDSAPIFTIHSFCQKALRDYAYEAGRPFDIGMISDESVRAVISEWLRSKWVNKVNKDDALFVDILNKKDSVSKFVDDIANKLVAAEGKYKGSENGIEIVNWENLEPLKIGDEIIGDEDILQFYRANDYDDLKEHPLLKEHLESLETHKDLSYNSPSSKSHRFISDFLDNIKEWKYGKNLFNAKTFSISTFITEKSSEEPYKSILKLHAIHKSGILTSSDSYVENKFISSQIPALFAEWQQEKIENKSQSFDDMILSVRKNILAKGIGNEDSALCQRIREEFKFAIIDEFQDTNQLQWDIFGTVFLGHQRSGVPDHAIIVVGDPKQSIYSFQGADIRVYQNAISEIEKIGKGFCLENNFRSTASMIDACNALFDESENTFFKATSASDDESRQEVEFKDSKVGTTKHEPEICGEPTKPFWISSNSIDEKDFAKAAVEKIVEWCSFATDASGNFIYDEKNEPKTNLRIFSKENEKELRNVTFKDFAILARTRTELPHIEEAMKKAGVPFVRYKDDKLFYGHECAQWIALFKALDAPNFSSYNRRILNEVLITDFFMVPLSKVEDECFDDPLCKERKCIAEWKALAQKRRFAEMQERIYADSGVEDRLKDLSFLQSRAKFIQIGNYAINYLYTNVCTLSDIIHQLERLSKNAAAVGEEDKDGNLIGKATDADAVQVMTIHASKGLEFPVVISIGGWKELYESSTGPFLYHNENSLQLGFSKNAREKRQAEENEEWKRLYYVDFTRASSILVLPHYKKMFDKDNPKKEYKFMVNALEKFHSQSEGETASSKADQFAEKLTLANIDNAELRKAVGKILEVQHKAPAETTSAESQKKAIKVLAGSMSSHCIMQHSYSSLGGKQDINVSAVDGENNDKNGPSSGDILIDHDPERIDPGKFDSDGNGYDEAAIKFPRGGKLGNAIHTIFELAKFKEFGKLEKPDDALNHPDFSELVKKQFKSQCFNIDKHPEWEKHTAEIVFNTLRAELPEIQGGSSTGRTFQLRELEESARKAEMQFNFTKDANAIEAGNHLHTICKGYIDLVFLRGNIGEERYSILDWKTDMIADSKYSFAEVQSKVDQDYSVQRVLYCYLLIKWLKQFKTGMSESEIFEKHFGGIYYAFVRGCKAGCSNGIYAQTWKNWAALEHEYLKNITKLMNKANKKLDGDDNE